MINRGRPAMRLSNEDLNDPVKAALYYNALIFVNGTRHDMVTIADEIEGYIVKLKIENGRFIIRNGQCETERIEGFVQIIDQRQ